MRLELSLYATNLKNVAGAFKGTSDPYAVVTQIATTPGAKPRVLGKTEVVQNSLSPQWTTTFGLEYDMGTPMKLAVSLFDEVRKGDHKSMGSAVFDVADVLGARGCTKGKAIGKGTLYATIRKSQGSGVFRFQIKATDLKNVEGFFSKSDPFFELERQVNDAGGQTWDNVFRSEWIKNQLNPSWKESSIELSTLCGGDLDLPLRLSVFDHEGSGKHIPMGNLTASVNELVRAAKNSTCLHLLKNSKQTGTIHVIKAETAGINMSAVTQQMAASSISEQKGGSVAAMPVSIGPHHFVDYLAGGLNLNVVVAIDFTGSNGNPRQPGTLHYIDDNSMNDYEKAISSIVGILAKYDSDQKFPVLGFGAKYDGVVKHCFQCGPTPEATGVQGVLSAYQSVFKTGLIMSSPTVFTEVIQLAAARAEKAYQEAHSRGQQAYTILLIVTDGAVSDIHATAECMRQVSDKPLSIVIVGVGTADFSGMQFLDDLESTPRKRDIAQFVAFNENSTSSVHLTSVTLKEIPDQVTGYFASKNISPLPAISAKEGEIIVEEEEEIDLSLNIGEDEIVVAGGGADIKTGF